MEYLENIIGMMAQREMLSSVVLQIFIVVLGTLVLNFIVKHAVYLSSLKIWVSEFIYPVRARGNTQEKRSYPALAPYQPISQQAMLVDAQ